MKTISETVLVIKILESKFQREQRTKIVFQKQKRKAKVPNFQENSLALQLRLVGNYGASWKLEWEPLMEAQKEDAKKRKKDREFLF